MSDKFHIRSKAGLSVRRSINNVSVFVSTAGKHGIDPRDVLAGSGIAIGDLTDPHRIITTAQEMMVGRRLAQLVPVQWIGLELGKHHHLISKGKLGMAAMCCETAREAMKLLISHIDLIGSYFQYDIFVDGNQGVVRFKELTSLKDHRRFICETEMVSLNAMFSLMLDDAQALQEIRLAYPAPEYAARYKEIFHCPIIFEAPEPIFIFDASFLDQPLKLANPLTKKVLEQECQQLCKRLNEDTTIKDRIRHELVFADGDFPTLDQLASRINMPERTIRRKLTIEGTSYKGILSDVRKLRALELIKTTDFSMEKIASQLGYCDAASFYHAFKTWTGATPASYRK